MADDLQSRVSAWLREQGFPLEMAAASLGREAGFEVSQSDYYIDPESTERFCHQTEA